MQLSITIRLQGLLSTTNISRGPLSSTNNNLTLRVSAPLPADLFENHVSFCPRLCCLFCRSLSLCCEGLRLLLMEVNFTTYMSYASLLSTIQYIFLSQCLAFLAIHPSPVLHFHSVLLHSVVGLFTLKTIGPSK